MKKCLELVNNAINNFQVEGTPRGCIPYGNGHINDTFYVVCDLKDGNEIKYIIQSINTLVFKTPEHVMHNIEKVTDFLIAKNPDRRSVLRLIKTYNGNTYYKDRKGNYWRMYEFINNSVCLDQPESLEDFYQCAVAFGRFQRDLCTFPADSLYETIADFHNTPKRYQDFLKAVEEDKCGRAKDVQDEINFIKERSDFYSVLLDICKEGKLPLRVSHNDTKINNSMLDKDTRKALCVIDLDTIMPGFSVTDFGDAIRFGANTAAEDEKDISKVKLDMQLFEIFAKGFLDGCEGQLIDSEIMLMPEGAKMMTIECGMRFLADYLEGDVYFRTAYKEHNLVRCRTQLKLVSEMEQRWQQMKKIVKKYCKKT